MRAEGQESTCSAALLTRKRAVAATYVERPRSILLRAVRARREGEKRGFRAFSVPGIGMVVS